MSEMPDAPDAPSSKFQLKPKTFERVNDVLSAPSTGPNDVYAILAQNQQHARPAEVPLDLRLRPSRRRRDYWLVLLAGNAAIGFVAANFPRNSLTLAFGASGMILFSLLITWVMWVVMDNY